jgi:hypothetical protein
MASKFLGFRVPHCYRGDRMVGLDNLSDYCDVPLKTRGSLN